MVISGDKIDKIYALKHDAHIFSLLLSRSYQMMKPIRTVRRDAPLLECFSRKMILPMIGLKIAMKAFLINYKLC